MVAASGKERIAAQIVGLAVPVDSLRLHPQNARQGDVGAITESLRRFGQMKPIVVQASTMFIVAGNHLYRGAVASGWQIIAAVVAEMDDTTAKAFMVADNRTQELGTYDADALGDLLAELAKGDHLAGTGYDGEDVDALLSRLASDQAQTFAPTAFLDTFLAPTPNPGVGGSPAYAATNPDGTEIGEQRVIDPNQPAAMPSDGYVQLVFVATPEQRERVYRAVKMAVTTGGFEKQIDALVLVADEYVRTH